MMPVLYLTDKFTWSFIILITVQSRYIDISLHSDTSDVDISLHYDTSDVDISLHYDTSDVDISLH